MPCWCGDFLVTDTTRVGQYVTHELHVCECRGEPDRVKVWRDVMRAALAVADLVALGDTQDSARLCEALREFRELRAAHVLVADGGEG